MPFQIKYKGFSVLIQHWERKCAEPIVATSRSSKKRFRIWWNVFYWKVHNLSLYILCALCKVVVFDKFTHVRHLLSYYIQSRHVEVVWRRGHLCYLRQTPNMHRLHSECCRWPRVVKGIFSHQTKKEPVNIALLISSYHRTRSNTVLWMIP